MKLALETKLRCVGSKGEQRRKKGRGALIRQREGDRERERERVWVYLDVQVWKTRASIIACFGKFRKTGSMPKWYRRRRRRDRNNSCQSVDTRLNYRLCVRGRGGGGGVWSTRRPGDGSEKCGEGRKEAALFVSGGVLQRCC